jgi:hypothetical protein
MPPEVIPKRLEQLNPSFFDELQAGDLLFIDSTHVIKPFSDVILELVHIMPNLRKGVIVHIHDVKLPFYSKGFLEKQYRHYEEQDMLACFLYGNAKWEVKLSFQLN